MKVGVGADHGGFEMKQQLAGLLEKEGHEVVDFGNEVHDTDDDYPDFAFPLARAVALGRIERGILVCGSGVGACIAANKVVGARAALCHDDFSAREGVEDDNMNILCFGVAPRVLRLLGTAQRASSEPSSVARTAIVAGCGR
jgi:ribose 5-phosphate isomerase B